MVEVREITITGDGVGKRDVGDTSIPKLEILTDISMDWDKFNESEGVGVREGCNINDDGT